MSDNESSSSIQVSNQSQSTGEIVQQTIDAVDEASRIVSDTHQEDDEQIDPEQEKRLQENETKWGDFLGSRDAVIANEDEPVDVIIRKATSTLIEVGGRLTTIFSNSIGSSTVPMGNRHPIDRVFDKMQDGANASLWKNPVTHKQIKDVEELTTALAHACCLCVRYADDEGEELTKVVRVNNARVRVHQFMKSLDEAGNDFVQVVRQMLVLVWTYGISKNQPNGKVHPLVVALFSGQHLFRYPPTIVLALLWLRAKIITILPKTHPGYEKTVRLLASVCPVSKYLKPQLGTFIELFPSTQQQMEAYAEQAKELPWYFQKDGSHRSILDWTKTLFDYDVVQQARSTYPEHYKEEIAQEELLRKANAKAAAAAAKAMPKSPPAAKGQQRPPPPGARGKSTPAPVAEQGKRNTAPSTKKSETAPNKPKHLSATLLNHKNQAALKEKNSKAAKKSVTFEEDEQFPGRSYVDPRTHQATLDAAQKGFAPLPRTGGKSNYVLRGFPGDLDSHPLQSHLMSTRQNHGLPASSRGFSQMRMYGGTAPPFQAEGEDEYAPELDLDEEDDDVFLQQRRERMDKVSRRRDMLKEEQLLTDKYLADEKRFLETQHRLATRHPDGGRQLVNNAFSIQCTYLQPALQLNPKDLLPNPLHSIQRRNNKKEKEKEDNEIKNYQCYFEAAVTDSHRRPMTKQDKIPVEVWPKVLTVQSDKGLVLNPLLWRNLHHATASYYDERMDEKDDTGDFECPAQASELLFGVAQKSTMQWLSDQFDEDNGEEALEYITTAAQNLVFKKKAYEKAVDKASLKEKLAYDKTGSYYPLGCVQKQEVADAYEEIIKRGIMNAGTIYVSMDIADRPTYSGLRIGLDKMSKDVKPFSSRNNLDPQLAPDENAKTLATKYTVPNVLTAMIFHNGFYANGSKELLMTRMQDLVARWKFGADKQGGEGLFITKCKKRDLPKLYLKFQDQLSATENKNMSIEDLLAMMSVWLQTVPKKTNQPSVRPPTTTDTPQVPKQPKNPRNPNKNNPNKGNHNNQQYPSWEQHWQQWQTPSNWNQWPQQQWGSWNQQQGGGKQGGGGKNPGGGKGGGGASLGVIPQADLTRARDPDVVQDDGTKIRKVGGGTKEINPNVAGYRDAIEKKTGCPVATMREAGKELCMFYLCELCEISNEKGPIRCVGKDDCTRDKGHKFTTNFYSCNCKKK